MCKVVCKCMGMEKLRNLLFQLMKHGTTIWDVAFIFLFSVMLQTWDHQTWNETKSNMSQRSAHMLAWHSEISKMSCELLRNLIWLCVVNCHLIGCNFQPHGALLLSSYSLAVARSRSHTFMVVFSASYLLAVEINTATSWRESPAPIPSIRRLIINNREEVKNVS